MTDALIAPPRPVDSPTAQTTWLSGLRVATNTDSPALSMAGGILAQLGARVTPLPDTRSDGVVPDLGGYDVVLVDRIGATPAQRWLAAADSAGYVDRVRALNRGVWVTASAFGLQGPRADAFASEVTLLAASGILGHTPGRDGDPPTIPAGSIGLKLVGNVIAMAALHGVHEQRRLGEPIHVDVSAQGAVISTGLALEMAHALAGCPDVGGSARYGAPTGFFPCTDGAVYVLVLEDHQWSGFRSVLGSPLDSIATLEAARNRSDEVNAAMAAWSATRTTAECERTLQGAGVPCTTVNTVEEFIDRARDAGRAVDLTGPHAAKIPARLRRYPRTEHDARADGPIPLQQLRVLDAGHVLAVPLSAAWLGAMGAQVSKLEDPARLDVYRRRGPFAAGVPGLNRSAYFNHLNFCKTPLDVRVDESGSTLDAEPFDVVLNNLSPHRAKRVGVDADSIAATSATTLTLSSSGFGLTGDWAGYRAYGTTIHAFAGLIAATRNARGEMAGVGTPWADPLTSVAITSWVLAWSLSSNRDASVSVDVSMSELMAAQLAELIGHDPDQTYRAPAYGGDLFLRLSSGRLLAVSLNGADDPRVFTELSGIHLPTFTRRGQVVDLRDGPLSRLGDHDLESALHAAGLQASLVYTAHDLARDHRLFDSELFQTVHSPDLGDYTTTGLPWQFLGRKKAPLVAAPERRED